MGEEAQHAALCGKQDSRGCGSSEFCSKWDIACWDCSPGNTSAPAHVIVCKTANSDRLISHTLSAHMDWAPSACLAVGLTDRQISPPVEQELTKCHGRKKE
jgi:hypothetical protein